MNRTPNLKELRKLKKSLDGVVNEIHEKLSFERIRINFSPWEKPKISQQKPF